MLPCQLDSSPMWQPPLQENANFWKVYGSQLRFHRVSQGEVNQMGGQFINGRPLPLSLRIAIIELHQVQCCMPETSHFAKRRVASSFN